MQHQQHLPLVDTRPVADGPMAGLFHPAVAGWFTETFGQPTPVQQQAWQVTARHRNALITAPTGSGKTLAAFLAAINDLVVEGVERGLDNEVHVVYVSPLKALSNDIQKNLQAPLAGIRERIKAMGLGDIAIRDAVRTGDTSQFERERMRRAPPHILVTTPESLFILLTSDSGRAMLKTTRSVIVDELHAVAGTKRGAHLALTLERLDAICAKPPLRIGLSATQKPIETMAQFLMGTRGLVPSPASGGGSGWGQPAAEPPPSQPPAARGGRSIAADERGICDIVDTGHTRKRDIALEVPRAPLTAVMANEVWGEVYDRLAELVEQHRTTLIFVNQRRLAERVARHLAERIGEEHVTSHHGSLAREHRLRAEQRLKSGQLKALVATSSLELGIDIGDVDLVIQIGSPRSINAFLQRVGRAGHAVRAIPKGRLFPQSLDDLAECAALIDCANRGELDRIHIPQAPLDVLAQQIVAEVACQEWGLDALHAQFRRALPYGELKLERFEELVRMLADGYSTKRGRRGALLHYDAVNRRLRGRRGAKLVAVTNAGTIPDQFDSEVVLSPEDLRIGTLNEDFAFESLPGDIVQLGNTSYRILKIETGRVIVEDAKGQPPNMPFWLGEAPGRSEELSVAVSRLRETADRILAGAPSPPAQRGETVGVRGAIAASDASESSGALAAPPPRPDPFRPGAPAPGVRQAGTATGSPGNPCLTPHAGGEGTGSSGFEKCARWLETEYGLGPAAALQLANYLGAARAALGGLPTRDTIYFERFFDEVGDTHLVIHAPLGSRVNRAWGLALRKRFCRQFNFELQAAALDDSLVLSLGPTHSFPLEDVTRFLHSNSAHDVLVQAVLQAPMFPTRWRWAASVALAVARNRNGKRVPPQFQRSDSEDLLTHAFPDAVACQDNLPGHREVPDHPLVQQALDDCLHEVMDEDGFLALLKRIESGETQIVCRDLTAPSPLSESIVNARPYAFLDDGAAEERRTLAVKTRGPYGLMPEPQSASDLGRLDPEAIARVRDEMQPDPSNADELHDALVVHGFLTDEEIRPWARMLDALAAARRVARIVGRAAPAAGSSAHDGGGHGPPYGLWVAAERSRELRAVLPDAQVHGDMPMLGAEVGRDTALRELIRSRMELLGPVTDAELAAPLGIGTAELAATLAALEGQGSVMRGDFTGQGQLEWCERRRLARIHRYTRDKRRAEFEPVSPAAFMRFLLEWQGLVASEQREGPVALEAVLAQLEGFPVAAAAWESEVLPARMRAYEPAWLDQLCASGRVLWQRLPNGGDGRKAAPVRSTPIVLLLREHAAHWQVQADADPELSAAATAVLGVLREHGASFFVDLVADSGVLRSQVESALGELVSHGLITADGFAGLRALVAPAEIKARRLRRGGVRAAFENLESAGRWSLVRSRRRTQTDDAPPDTEVEYIVRVLLRRYGVLFRKLIDREPRLPPWRELYYVLRRLEARGEIRGGRFVSGFAGEQFALTEAAGALRKHREDQDQALVVVAGCDPLNLTGTLLPGERVPALPGHRVLLRGGVPVASLVGGEAKYLVEADSGTQWNWRNRLLRGTGLSEAVDAPAMGGFRTPSQRSLQRPRY